MFVSAAQAGAMLRGGAVGVVPTESVYGLIALATDVAAIERVYDVKHRPSTKPCIVLIAQPEDMAQFDIEPSDIITARQYWPGKVSVVVPCSNPHLEHLTRGTGSIAFRVAGTAILQEILALSGPIIAPSANPDTLAPATTIQQAQDYFGESIDFYVDGGICNEPPSKVVHAKTGKIYRK